MVGCRFLSGAMTMSSGESGHFADFFDRDDQVVAAAVNFLDEGFANGASCIAVMTEGHRAAIERELSERGWNAQELIDDYRLISMGAHEPLASLWIEDRLDPAQLYKQFSELIRLMSSGGRSVRIIGELVQLLAQYGRFDAVVQLEEMWNDLSRERSFRMYCLYCESTFVRPLEPTHRRRICAVHSGSLAET